jgi:hypothetical protein
LTDHTPSVTRIEIVLTTRARVLTDRTPSTTRARVQ